MLNVEISLNRIDYEKTVEALYPMILSAVSGLRSKNMGVRILQNIAGDSRDALISFMKSLNNEEKTELLVHFCRCYEKKILEKVTLLLHRSGYGNKVALGRISMAAGQSGIRIYICDVKPNYREVMDLLSKMDSLADSMGIKAAKAFSSFTPNFILRGAGDFAVLKALEKDELVNKITEMIQAALRKYNIQASVGSFCVAKTDDARISPPVPGNPNAPLPSHLSDLLVDKASKFILRLIKGDKKGGSAGSGKQTKDKKPKKQPEPASAAAPEAEPEIEMNLQQIRAAAERGDADAQIMLGVRYYNGEGVDQDFGQAVHWLMLAARQGNAVAQYNMGVCYAYGMGLPRDYAQAAQWYKLAAVQGYDAAQNSFGFCCYEGRGIAQDSEQAARWFRAAAEQGNAAGQYNLGFCFERGIGVTQNRNKAVYWYELAAKQGSEDAIEALKKI